MTSKFREFAPDVPGQKSTLTAAKCVGVMAFDNTRYFSLSRPREMEPLVLQERDRRRIEKVIKKYFATLAA